MPEPRSNPLRVTLVGLIAGGYSGIPRYAAALTRAVDAVASEFPRLRLELLTTREGAAAADPRSLRVREVGARGRHANAGPGRIALEQAHAVLARSDLLHFFDTSGPVLAPWRPFVTTVHDLSVMKGLRPRKHGYKRLLWPWAVRNARAVVAISAFTGEEAVRLLQADPERLRVIHSGPGLSSGEAAGPVSVGTGRPPFFLYVGQLAASKNLPFLVDAFGDADIADDVRLILVGRPGDGYITTRAAIDRSPRRDRIEILEGVADGELERLYRSAVALVHPALYEGFGFTPLEAMARNCVVIASDIPALRETAGDGALLVPLDRGAWARALQQVACEETLRATLRAKGERRVAQYSWHETARELCRTFECVGGVGTPGEQP